MPLYEYVCRKCSRLFEELVFDKKDPACPSCKADNVERVLSAHAVGHSHGLAGEASCENPCGNCSNPGGCGMN